MNITQAWQPSALDPGSQGFFSVLSTVNPWHQSDWHVAGTRTHAEGKRAGVLGFESCACPSHVLRRPGGHPANLRQESSPGPPQAPRGNGHKATQSGQAEQRLQGQKPRGEGTRWSARWWRTRNSRRLPARGQLGVTSAAGCTTPSEQ